MTNHRLGQTAILCFALLHGAQALADKRVFDVTDFNEVSAAAGLRVTVHQGEDYSVEAEGSAKALERLKVKRIGSKLSLSLRRKSFWPSFWGTHNAHVYVTLPELRRLDVSSGAALSAKDIDADELRVSVSSGASTTVQGQCNRVTVNVSSGASADTREFICAEATVTASSGATGRVHTTQGIDATASSGGNVRVDGAPEQVRVHESSGGNVSVRSNG